MGPPTLLHPLVNVSLLSPGDYAPCSSERRKKIADDPSAIYDHASCSFFLPAAFPTLPAIRDIKGVPVRSRRSVCLRALEAWFIIATRYRDKRASWTREKLSCANERIFLAWRTGTGSRPEESVFVKSNRIRERRRSKAEKHGNASTIAFPTAGIYWINLETPSRWWEFEIRLRQSFFPRPCIFLYLQALLFPTSVSFLRDRETNDSIKLK